MISQHHFTMAKCYWLLAGFRRPALWHKVQCAPASNGFDVEEEEGEGGLCMMVVGPDRMVVQTGKKKKRLKNQNHWPEKKQLKYNSKSLQHGI